MLRSLASVLLTFGGLGALVAAGFLVALPLGLLVLGLALLVVEAVLL